MASALIATTAAAHGSGPPVKTVAPSIHGKTLDGHRLKAVTGKWTGATTIAHAYSWERCNGSGAECEPIAGAVSNRYSLTPGDVGHRLVVAETASNAEGADEERSLPSALILAVAPKHKGRVTPTGEAVDGRVLSVGTGTWKGTPPFTYGYQWYRCGKGCEAIAGATGAQYRAATADIGKKLKAVITATNTAGSGSQRTISTAKVLPGSPVNLAAPSISGTPLVGQTLTAEPGTWAGTPPIAFGYQWYACSLSGCEAIAGATEQTHEVGLGEFGGSFEVEVTATNAQGSATAISEPTNLVGGNAPIDTEPPTVSGTPTAGQLLTASSGKWTGTEPITYEYEWLRCDTSGAECVQAAAPSILPTYSVAGADVGHTLRAKAIAKNIAGSGSAESEPTATVAGVEPSNVLAPTVLGLDITGQTLTATEGAWTGTEPIAYSFQWQQCSKAGTECKDLTGETKSTYVIGNGDAAHTLRVVVTAKNVAGSTEKESATTGEVLGVVPANTEAPAVSGEAKEGQLLTASSGKWSGTEPITYEYEWLRCNSEGKACAQAAGASLLGTYSVVAADVGHTLRAKVIAKNIAGSASAESAPTATVLGVPPANVVLPVTVPVGTTTSGSTVTATEGTWTGAQPISYVWEWKICTSATSCKVEQKGASNSFKVPSASGGKKLRVNVIAANAAGEAAKEALELSILI